MCIHICAHKSIYTIYKLKATFLWFDISNFTKNATTILPNIWKTNAGIDAVWCGLQQLGVFFELCSAITKWFHSGLEKRLRSEKKMCPVAGTWNVCCHDAMFLCWLQSIVSTLSIRFQPRNRNAMSPRHCDRRTSWPSSPGRTPPTGFGFPVSSSVFRCGVRDLKFIGRFW